MIPVTYRASFSYLLRHPWQLALALLGISVGVAVIVAVDLANASARKAFLLSMDTITGEATHQIIGGPRGVGPSRLRNRPQNNLACLSVIRSSYSLRGRISKPRSWQSCPTTVTGASTACSSRISPRHRNGLAWPVG
jgi:hypothetical protein